MDVKYASQRPGLMITRPPIHVHTTVNGMPALKQMPRPPIQFKRGIFVARSEDEVEAIETSPLYPDEVWRVSGLPERVAARHEERTGSSAADASGGSAESDPTTDPTSSPDASDESARPADSEDDQESTLTPIEGVTNKNEALAALADAGVDTSELPARARVEDVKDFAARHGYTFVGY